MSINTGIAKTIVVSAIMASDNLITVGTDAGKLYIYDRKNKKTPQIYEINSSTIEIIRNIFYDENKNLIIFSTYHHFYVIELKNLNCLFKSEASKESIENMQYHNRIILWNMRSNWDNKISGIYTWKLTDDFTNYTESKHTQSDILGHCVSKFQIAGIKLFLVHINWEMECSISDLI